MTKAPKRIWAWCFNLPGHGGWSSWGGYARPGNRYPLDENERATGAEYILAAEHDRIVAEARRAALEEAAMAGYRICAETRHVTLGNQVAAVIRALAEKE